MGWLLRVYIDQLVKGNPFVIGLTMVAAAAVSVGPFYDGLSKRDPWAIGLVVLILLGITLVLAVAIVDRKLNAPKQKAKRPPARSRGR
jgi:F0F1-type ATP synthase assembly protein I